METVSPIAAKTQFIDVLAHLTGLTNAQAETVVNKLPDALGIWLKNNCATAPGQFIGEMDGGLRLELNRQANPNQWNLNTTLTGSGLIDFGDGSDRFGLPVVNV